MLNERTQTFKRAPRAPKPTFSSLRNAAAPGPARASCGEARDMTSSAGSRPAPLHARPRGPKHWNLRVTPLRSLSQDGRHAAHSRRARKGRGRTDGRTLWLGNMAVRSLRCT